MVSHQLFTQLYIHTHTGIGVFFFRQIQSYLYVFFEMFVWSEPIKNFNTIQLHCSHLRILVSNAYGLWLSKEISETRQQCSSRACVMMRSWTIFDVGYFYTIKLFSLFFEVRSFTLLLDYLVRSWTGPASDNLRKELLSPGVVLPVCCIPFS